MVEGIDSLVARFSFGNSSRHRFMSGANKKVVCALRIAEFLNYFPYFISGGDKCKFDGVRRKYLDKLCQGWLNDDDLENYLVSYITEAFPGEVSCFLSIWKSDIASMSNVIAEGRRSIGEIRGKVRGFNVGMAILKLLSLSQGVNIRQEDMLGLIELIELLRIDKDNNEYDQLTNFIRDIIQYEIKDCGALQQRYSNRIGWFATFNGNSAHRKFVHIDGGAHYAFGHQCNHLISRELLSRMNGKSVTHISRDLVSNQFLALYEMVRFPSDTILSEWELCKSIINGSHTGRLGLASVCNMESYRYNLLKSSTDYGLDKAICGFLSSRLTQYLPRIPPKFVCLYVRDGGFKAEASSSTNSNLDRWHCLDTTVDLVRHLINEGVHVIRIGDSSSESLSLKNKLYWEYSHSDAKNDVADILIPLSADYLICGGAGGSASLPIILEKDSFHYDYPVTRTIAYDPNSLILTKSLHKKAGERVRFRNSPDCHNYMHLIEDYRTNSEGSESTIRAFDIFKKHRLSVNKFSSFTVLKTKGNGTWYTPANILEF